MHVNSIQSLLQNCLEILHRFIIVPSTSCPTLKMIKLEVVHLIFNLKKQLLKIKTTFNLKLHVHICIIFIIYGKMSQIPNQGYQKVIA